MTEPSSTINDWLKAQKALLDLEREMAAIAERYARGAATQDELRAAHALVVAQRALAEAVFQKALARKA